MSQDNTDRHIMEDLMEILDQKDLGICPKCNQEGIILTANKRPDDKTDDEIKGCWVCIKNNKVVNTTGLGFA